MGSWISTHFVNPAMLGSLALVAVPIIIWLLSRAKSELGLEARAGREGIVESIRWAPRTQPLLSVSAPHVKLTM